MLGLVNRTIKHRHPDSMVRLRKLKLWTFQEKRNRADLIELFKNGTGHFQFSMVPMDSCFQLADGGHTRGHG